MKRIVTEPQARRVLRAVRKAYRGHDTTNLFLAKDWQFGHGSTTKFAIVWEEGPYEWALDFTGEAPNYLVSQALMAKNNIFIEPYTSFALAVCDGWDDE